MDKSFLSIGTVVSLKENNQKVIIVGFLANKENEDKVYDYCGFDFPKGYLGVDKITYFDDVQIDKVIYPGMENDEEQLNFHKQLVSEFKSINNNGNKSSEEISVSIPVFTPLN